MAVFEDDPNGFWAARFGMTPDDQQAMRDQAADQARQAYADETQAMASGAPDGATGDGSSDGGGVDRFQTAYQDRMGQLMAQRAAGQGPGGQAARPPMMLSDNGAALIQRYESYKPTAYVDGDPGLTIGWGHKLRPGESFPRGVDRPTADRMFRADVSDAEAAVRRHVKVPLNQNQFDALTSLVYNAGPAPLLPDTHIGDALARGDYAAAAKGFALWNKSGPKGHLSVRADLIRRRAEEAALFSTPLRGR